MPPNARLVPALFLIPGILLIAAPGARAADSCDLTLHGFSANGKRFVMQEECMGSRTATLKIGTLATGQMRRIARGSTPYSRADVIRHARVRPLRLMSAVSNPGWTAQVKKRGARFTFELRKGQMRLRLGRRTFRRTRAIVVKRVYWEQKLRGVVLRVAIHRGVGGHAGEELIGFPVKGLAPAVAGGLLIMSIPKCRVLVSIFRCMVRVTPAGKRAQMKKTADGAIAKMERALGRSQSSRGAFSRSCAEQSRNLRRQFRKNAIYGRCMR